jgi:hypothetical protein
MYKVCRGRSQKRLYWSGCMMENAPERVMMTGCPKQRKVGFIYILDTVKL